MSTNAKFLIEYHENFIKTLDQSRNRIDLSTVSGKNLDLFLTPIYKKYGFFDDVTKTIDLNVTDIPEQQFKFFNQPITHILQELGINTDFLKQFHQRKLISPEGQRLMSLYTKAFDALKSVKKKLLFDKYNSGNSAWDIFGVLHWVTDLDKEIAKLIADKVLYANDNTKIVEYLQNLLYTKPTKITENIAKTAKKFNISNQDVNKIFLELTESTVEDYQQLIIEGLGDYIRAAGKKFTTPGVNFKQAKNIVRAEDEEKEKVNNILDDWYRITKGNEQLATPTGLTNFLENEYKVNPNISRRILANFKNQFAKTNTGKPYLKNANLPLFFKDIHNAASSSPLTTATAKRKPAVKGVAATATPAAASTTTPTQRVTVQQAVDNLPPNQRAPAILQALSSLGTADIQNIVNHMLTKKP